MVTVKYRLIGSINNAIHSKEFKTRAECDAWIKAQGNILVLEVESSGAAAFNRIFG
jgi:hypothetical protein